MKTFRTLVVVIALSAVGLAACSNEETGPTPDDTTTVVVASPVAATVPAALPTVALTAQTSGGSLEVGARVTILNSTGDSIRLRVTPSMTSVTFATVPNGSSAVITSGPANAEGRTWYEIETSEGKGWTQSDFLRPSSTQAADTQQHSNTEEANEDDSPNSPRGVIANFYLRLEQFDTAGMLQLVCPEIRDETESGLSMLQSVLGLGSVLGVGASNWDIVDFDAKVLSQEGDSAKVQVSGRLLAGAPLGSTSLDDVIDVRKEDGGWCLTDTGLSEDLNTGSDRDSAATSTRDATVRIEPSSTSVSMEAGSFTVSVVVADVANLGAFEIELTYEPAVLRFVGIEQGTFLASSGRQVQCYPPQTAEGSVYFYCVTLGSTPDGPNGSGLLASVAFEPVAPGSTTLRLARLTLTDPPAQPLPAQGQDAIVAVSED